MKSTNDRLEDIEREKSTINDTLKLHNAEKKKIQKIGGAGDTEGPSKEEQKLELDAEHDRLKQEDAVNNEKITQEGKF